MNLPEYEQMSKLQSELGKSSGIRKQYLQSKYDLYYNYLMNVLLENNLPLPRKGCTLCYLYGWTNRAARESGLLDRSITGAKIGL